MPVQTSRPAFVVPFVAIGLLSFSASPILVRLADDGPALAVATWRTVFAVLFLAPIALPRIGGEMRRLPRREALLIGAAGVLLGVHFIAWIGSLYLTSVASASVFVTTSPIFVALLGYLFLHERLGRPEVLAIVLAVPGAALIGWGDATMAGAGMPHALWGNALALGASLLVSIYLLIGRVVRQRRSWLGYLFPLYGVVAVTALATALLAGVPLFGYDPAFYGFCALLAIGPSILGHGSFNYALRYVSAALLSLLALLEPVLASALAYVLFDERPSGFALAGMALVLVGVASAVRPAPKQKAARMDE